ncbi:MAG TPA: gamma-glutamylcyclotransferase family protein [Bryobacteraceae bacterium]|jgi:gamma-glutamylcyclotransferase (GGCT)/AIG2-like uncharacterized protein YtfP|nr:gamma-glutamylcyclotransferase family protein [Bryobacteraceae bacterium]
MPASTSDFPSPPNFLFVYGTLRTGELRHHMLAAARILTIVPAEVAGSLLDFWEYPGLVAAENGSRVRGELIELQSFSLIADALDEEEGPDFRRELTDCVGLDGRKCLAWVYRFTGSTEGAEVVVSGDWKARRMP